MISLSLLSLSSSKGKRMTGGGRAGDGVKTLSIWTIFAQHSCCKLEECNFKVGGACFKTLLAEIGVTGKEPDRIFFVFKSEKEPL